jgi:hypothetical protein
MNQMMRHNHGYNCQSQSHTPLEDDITVDACEAYVSSFFIFFWVKKPKILLRLNNINKQIIVKLHLSP